MKKVLVALEDEIFDKLKADAKVEKRTVSNYAAVIIENLIAPSIEKDIDNKNSNVKMIYNKPITNSTAPGKPMKEKDLKVFLNEMIKNNARDTGTEEFEQLEDLGKSLRVSNENKPPHLKGSGSIFSPSLSDHERGWLYKNPSKTIEDYKKTFDNIF